MNDRPALVNINTAGPDELMTVSGIGPEMAGRIQAARPFESLEDLQRVSGIGPAILERWQPYLTLASSENGGEGIPAEVQEEMPASELASFEEIPAEELDETVTGEEMPVLFDAEQEEPEMPTDEITEPEDVTPLEDKPAPAPKPAITPTPQKQEQRFASRGQVFWWGLAALVVATLLGAALSLGVLALINNSLTFALPTEVTALSRQIDGVSSQADILQQDMDGMRTRLDNLESLSGRVGEMERSVSAIQKDADALQTRVVMLGEQVDGLDGAVTELQARTDRFQGFLEGLRNLMDGIFTP